MAVLQYDFRVVGANNVEKAFASIERRAGMHNARMARAFGQSPTSASGGGVKAQERQAEAANRKWAAEHQRFAQGQMRAHDRLAAAKEREHRAQLSRIAREQAAQNRAAASALAAQKRVRAATVGQVGRSVVSATRAVGMIGTGALAIGGGMAVQGAISQQMRETAAASSLANQVGRPEIKGQLLTESQGVRGFSGEESLGAMSAFFTKTGNLDAARSVMRDMGKLALATGSDFSEMSEAAGQAFNVIRDTITDPKEQLAAMNDVMRSLAAQGTLGAVEIRDMATELGSLGAAARKFEGGPVELLKSMGALAQASVARGGATNAAEASTAVTRFAADLTKKPSQKALEALDINVFTDSTNSIMRDPMAIMADIMGKTGGDLKQLEEIFNAESKKVFQGFAPLAREGVLDENGNKLTGKDAMMFEFNRFAKATVSDADINSRAQSRLDDPDLKFKEAMKDFNAKVGSELLPELTKLIPEVAKLTPYVADAARLFAMLVGSLVDNPVLTIGTLIAGKVAADIAGAKIGEGIKNVLSGAVGEGAAGALGAGSIGMTLGAAAALTIYASGVTSFHAEQVASETEGKLLNEARRDPTKARENLAKLRESFQKESTPTGMQSALGGVYELLAMTGGKFVDDSGKEISKEEAFAQKRESLGIGLSQERAKTSAAIEAELLALAMKQGEAFSKAAIAGAGANRSDQPSKSLPVQP